MWLHILIMQKTQHFLTKYNNGPVYIDVSEDL